MGFDPREDAFFRANLAMIFSKFEAKHSAPVNFRLPLEEREKQIGSLEELQNMIVDAKELTDWEKQLALEQAPSWYSDYRDRLHGIF